jgi:hypothetical protein
MNTLNFTRRQALGISAALVAGARLLRGQGRTAAAAVVAPPDPPANEVVNAFEFLDVARTRLSQDVYASIAGGDREPFDRLTFRPRMCNPTMAMDLSVELFGQTLFTPILVGPIAEQARYHPEGELATVRGAGAAYTTVVVSDRSSVPIGQIAAAATQPFWYSVYADADAGAHARAAVNAGARVVIVTVGTASPGRAGGATGSIDWGASWPRGSPPRPT